jgi:hypothetical protein
MCNMAKQNPELERTINMSNIVNQEPGQPWTGPDWPPPDEPWTPPVPPPIQVPEPDWAPAGGCVTACNPKRRALVPIQETELTNTVSIRRNPLRESCDIAKPQLSRDHYDIAKQATLWDHFIGLPSQSNG